MEEGHVTTEEGHCAMALELEEGATSQEMLL